MYFLVASWCSGYHYCTTSCSEAWHQVLRRFKPCSRRVGDSRWWGSLTMVPAGNKAKRLSSVNHTTKTIHHHHHHHLHRVHKFSLSSTLRNSFCLQRSFRSLDVSGKLALKVNVRLTMNIDVRNMIILLRRIRDSNQQIVYKVTKVKTTFEVKKWTKCPDSSGSAKLS